MNNEQLIAEIHPRLTAIRRDLHAHPELAFAEIRTAELVGRRLDELGIEVHRGLAGTGVVGRLRVGTGSGSIGLRADMDALPLQELNDFGHRSTHAGRMHACGHDGHTAMLLGAAEVLARTRAFDGTVHFIFQPAEETEGGGKRMVDDGLFERFPMDSVYGLHNWPGLSTGEFAVHPGPMMAGADFFDIRLRGGGAHAAMPHQGRDVILAAATLVQALQSLVARNVNPLESAVVSVTRIGAGHADNILPDEALLGGTTRMFRPGLRALLENGMRRVCHGIAATHDVAVELDYRFAYPPTVNAEAPAALAERAARRCLGDSRVHTGLDPSMGAEDFAFLAERVPACYAWLGNGPGEGGCVLHSPRYDFNDAVIPHGVSYWVELVQTAMPRYPGA